MRSILLSALIMIGIAVPASAQEWRNYISTEVPYAVVGVEYWDVLNLRAGPGVRNPKVGALSPNARGVLVETCNRRGTWCRVSGPGGQRGWANMRYLGGYAD